MYLQRIVLCSVLDDQLAPPSVCVSSRASAAPTRVLEHRLNKPRRKTNGMRHGSFAHQDSKRFLRGTICFPGDRVRHLIQD
jgi:hypothetical protein